MFKTATVLALAATGAAAVSPLSEVQYQSMFSAWIKEHGKQYKAEEVFAKFSVFKMNHRKISEHNAAGKSWTMAHNEFMDLTADEFKAQYMGYRGPTNSYARAMNAAPETSFAPLADSVDWRTKGAVTPVKNQGQCGSCWAFSTTGSTEGAYFLKNNNLLSFSEQELVDCASDEGNQGCNGGLMDQGFEYIIKKGSLCKESDYPYTASTDSCNLCSSPVDSPISGYKDVTQGSESALKTAVNQAPVSIAIEADQSSFQFYSGGVMDGNCGTQLDHGVLLVGYGTDGGKDYWTVKNSWGASWGEEGYIRLIQGRNQCGLANAASYPTTN